ncbi:MAG: DedA family protein [Patescibacteria group bacterium]|nr:DedA family protein [Patescibacteria group bacterium]
MSPSIIHFLTQYGYVAIIGLIVVQELGIPVPAPNELLLMFFGYLAYLSTFNLVLAAAAATVASMIGAWILYGAFYFIGEWVMHHPRIPFPRSLVKNLSEKISKRSIVAVMIGRVVPFGRGYICVAAGLMKVKPWKFATAVIVSDIVWNFGFVILGYVSGPYWNKVAKKVGGVEHIFLLIILSFFAIILTQYLIKKIKKHRSKKAGA